MGTLSGDLKGEFEIAGINHTHERLFAELCTDEQLIAFGEVISGYVNARFTQGEMLAFVQKKTPEEIKSLGEELKAYAQLFQPEALAEMHKSGQLKDVLDLGREHALGKSRLAEAAPEVAAHQPQEPSSVRAPGE